MSLKDVVIVGCKRTSIGIFMGSLAPFSATNLGSIAIEGALANTKLEKSQVEEVYMGNVLSASLGQAPTTQAALGAGLSKDTICTTVNKGCASGMKATILATQAIRSGQRKIVVAGGMESMTGAPHYINIREPVNINNPNMKYLDSILLDGYTEMTENARNIHLGKLAEKTIAELEIKREVLDSWTKISYQRARAAQANKFFDWEIVDIMQATPRGRIRINQDEECKRYLPQSLPVLLPIYSKNGCLTAASSGKLNDGASAMILMEEESAREIGMKPLARIKAYEDSALDPTEFTIANSKVTSQILRKAGMNSNDIDFYEIHENFASVPMVNMEVLGLDPDIVNVNGGALALGHPLGASGNRIIISLLNILRQKGGTIGLASVSHGGGGASAVMIERLN
ncbi:unnamed protein product [Moneuplotes crassus]|uniref:Acetyl-CoA C-acetyltransferase n=1 Tax=Euplotes crassus TaxID=5936 RepID=A0AAD1UP19_EUPCR|nr:unnamed protein product [Moneuplotes crassus]